MSGRKTELQEHAADSTPDQSVPTQDRSLDWQANRQNRNGRLANGTSFPSSSNADLLPENDTIFNGEKPGPEHKQHSLLPCTQRSEKTTDDVPVSSMNEECNLQSFEGAVIANDYPRTFKSFDDCVSSNSIASATVSSNSLFDNYLPKVKLTLLNNPRDDCLISFSINGLKENAENSNYYPILRRKEEVYLFLSTHRE